jgi:streptomycin 6-kinase
MFDHDMFDGYLAEWGLVPDGDPIATHSSRLLPVRQAGVAAMLKVAVEAEEKFGCVLMTWWDGQGAARVLDQRGDAILLERAEGRRSLSDMARNGRDDEATRIICATVAKLHAPRAKPRPDLVPLPQWFQELAPAAAIHGGVFTTSAKLAHALLADPRDVGVLHGDIHHDNVLDFGERGWLAVDPKRLLGERAFDYANLFCNPDLADPAHPVATAPGRFARRLEIVSDVAGLEPQRLLQWIVAWCGLSAAWYLSDRQPAEIDLKIAEFALAELGR